MEELGVHVGRLAAVEEPVSLAAPASESSRRSRLLQRLHAQPPWLGWAVGAILPVLVAPIAIVRDDPHELSAGRVYLLVVAVVAFFGGLGPALLATALSFAALAWLFAPPGQDVTDQLGALALFLVAAVVISDLMARRKAAERDAAEARQRAERLQQVTAALVQAHTTKAVLDVIVRAGHRRVAGAARRRCARHPAMTRRSLSRPGTTSARA